MPEALAIRAVSEAQLLGGALADGAVGDFLTLVGGCVGVGAGLGSIAAWLLRDEPRSGAGAGYGSALGAFIGALVAIVDVGLGD